MSWIPLINFSLKFICLSTIEIIDGSQPTQSYSANILLIFIYNHRIVGALSTTQKFMEFFVQIFLGILRRSRFISRFTNTLSLLHLFFLQFFFARSDFFRTCPLFLFFSSSAFSNRLQTLKKNFDIQLYSSSAVADSFFQFLSADSFYSRVLYSQVGNKSIELDNHFNRLEISRFFVLEHLKATLFSVSLFHLTNPAIDQITIKLVISLECSKQPIQFFLLE